MNQLISQLRAWQFREWLFAALFAVAVLLAVFAVLLGAACATDWVYDRYADTPFWLRLPLSAVLALGTLGAAYLLFRSVRAPALDDLAFRAEEAHPDVGHRLVTSLQLTRPTAKTAGMSAQLIDAVVDEAGEMAKKKRLASLADTTKLGRAALVFFPLLLAVGIAVVLFGNLLWILVQRQLYLGGDIPRSTTLTAAHRELWPAGDPAVLHVRVSGPLRDTDVGVLLATPVADDGTVRDTETHELKFDKWEVENETALFVAKLPPASESLTFHARLADGRTRAPGQVRFAPRPVVTDPVVAYVLMPVYVDPAGKRRYERITPQGEVTAHRDCGARVVARISKPVVTANLVLLGRDPAGVETVLETKPMALRTATEPLIDPETKKPKLDADGKEVTVLVGYAEATFELELPPAGPKLPPRLPSGYRIEVTDENGFTNAAPPRRGITITPDDPPRVALLDEVNKAPKDPGPSDDYEVRGIPLKLGDKVAIGYRASSALGLLHAHLVYRVNDEAEWNSLPLSAVSAEPKDGRFVPELGLFENSEFTQSVQFYPIPSADPENEPSGLAGGGKYVFPVDAIRKQTPDKKGKTKLEVGDRVEFYVAVYDRKFALLSEADRRRRELPPTLPPAGAAAGSGDRPPTDAPSALRPPGASESRIKKIVTRDEFQAWLDQRDRSKESLRRIEDIQRGVFGQRK